MCEVLVNGSVTLCQNVIEMFAMSCGLRHPRFYDKFQAFLLTP